ncbi:MAG: PEGA domain-containing protein, partial [Sandaracinaceae bacterium]|nr:PEGA domain-containing protein [Sandaracinaceae bacterium]
MRALLLLASLLAAPLARAQDADALLDEGIALREQGRDEEALARFEQAQALAPSARALAQIALAEQALGRFADAERHLQEALSDVEDRFIRRNQALLEQALGEIATQLGTLRVEGPDGASLRVDGEPRGTLPVSLRIVRGSHRIEVTLEGHVPHASEIEIEALGERELRVELEPVAAAEVEPARPPPTMRAAAGGPDWMTIAGIATAGSGVVALGIATGLMIGREDHAQARLACSDTDPVCRDHFY